MPFVARSGLAQPTRELSDRAALFTAESSGARPLLREEEANHLSRRVGPRGIGMRSAAAAAGPGMARAMQHPMLDDGFVSGVRVHYTVR